MHVFMLVEIKFVEIDCFLGVFSLVKAMCGCIQVVSTICVRSSSVFE